MNSEHKRAIGRRGFNTLALGAGAGVALGSYEARAQSAAYQADLDALVKAAKAEGELVCYVSQTENVARRVHDAFTAKYGIKISFARFDSVPLQQRYSSEAQAGTFAASLVTLAGGADDFVKMCVEKGWMEPISELDVPMLKHKMFPEKMNRGRAAIIQISPWMLAYNTDKVKKEDLPKTWMDLTHPRWKGEVLISDPNISDAYIDFFALLQDRFGNAFFDALRPNIRKQGGPVQAGQALGAGEGSFHPPEVVAQVMGVKSKGGPVDAHMLDYTTGVQIQVMLTTRKLAKHHNAAKLLANYMMSEEGNQVFNADPGAFTVYDTSKLPKEYEPPKAGTSARRAEIAKLLGF